MALVRTGAAYRCRAQLRFSAAGALFLPLEACSSLSVIQRRSSMDLTLRPLNQSNDRIIFSLNPVLKRFPIVPLSMSRKV